MSELSAIRYSIAGIGLTVMLIGCGGPTTYPVGGKVTLDGKPLPRASISFISEAEDGPSGFGTTDDQGQYTIEPDDDVDGLPVGKYKVRIWSGRESNPDDDPPQAAIPETVPMKYNTATTLIADVKAEENTIPFKLDSKGQIYVPREPRSQRESE